MLAGVILAQGKLPFLSVIISLPCCFPLKMELFLAHFSSWLQQPAHFLPRNNVRLDNSPCEAGEGFRERCTILSLNFDAAVMTWS